MVYCWPAESPARSTLPPSFMYERNSTGRRYQPVGIAASAAGGAGDQVVSGLPDDGVVVAEHSEASGVIRPAASMS